ncbi:sulfite exporter TauE/SafE family protein [Sinorhizobium sp. RAC02]|uniref:sulfite exporter TauE/SafE family protein n=1 Tax=Sinorhizobium sp. RAC02 TaxID=1842534 RepID=UPI0008569C5E|nr:sulfite exporter TauE/SafE family protein [Sinorhizobium sp. RAC02]AOF92920.1 sulfite exporter TauE/SafE family protein [Sinorhizobium sp. RAC02]
MTDATNTSHARSPVAVFGGGAIIGALGGLIGLGGAEFRLPILIGFFNFAALEAVILNKAMSLVVVATALPFRAGTVPFSVIADNWPIVLYLLAGILIGAWFGAGWATKLRSETLYKVIAVMLVTIAIVLVLGHDASAGQPMLTGARRLVAGVVAGFIIGIVASLLSVAGGELLIPTLLLLFGADIKLAGSLSLAVSLPTMLVGFNHYSRDQSFSVIGRNKAFLLIIAAGSIVGTFIDGLLLGIVPNTVLLPTLAIILLISAVKGRRHWGSRAKTAMVCHRGPSCCARFEGFARRTSPKTPREKIGCPHN